MIMSTRTLARFLGSLVVATWLVQIAALIVVGDVESEAMTPWFLGSMFMPMIWSVAYLTLFNRKAWRLVRLWPGNPLYLLLAGLLPAALAFSVLAILESNGWGSSSFFSFAGGEAAVVKGPWVLGLGEQSWDKFAVNVAFTALMFAGINSVVAVGEEFGWRAHLQQHMIERFGFIRGVALLGFVWAMWHAPMNLAGYNHPEAPVLGTFVLFPLQLIAISFVMAWLTLRARSFWPAVLLHGSGNGIEAGVMSSLKLTAGVSPLTADLLSLGVTLLLALVCIVMTPSPKAEPSLAT